MRALAALIVATTLGAGCAPPSERERVGRAAGPIQGGTEDATDTSVVAIANTQINELCTGARIAPNLVLTAAHCISTTTTAGQTCAAFVFGGVVDPSKLLYTDATTAPSTFGGYEKVLSASTPAVAGESLCDRDIALVVLETPKDATASAPLVPRVDEPMTVGELFTAIGYGQVGGGAGIGTRRRLDGLHGSCVGDCEKPYTGVLEWIGHPEVAHTGGRPGDSGSPAIDAEGEIVGVFVRHLEYPPSTDFPDELVYTAIDPHRDFLREGARAAAEVGGYAAPPWAVDPPPDDAPPPDEEPEASGCTIASVTEAPPRTLPLSWMAAVVAGLLLRQRRGRERKRARGSGARSSC